MLISYNWLKSYVKNLPEPEKLAEVFSFHICELESFEKIENGDYVFDIKVLPDRAHDLLCHRGVARDLALVLNLKYNDISYNVPEGSPTNLGIKIESEFCCRYIGRIVRNVKVSESPKWVKEHLESMGQRSINNLVDATNIVMYDRGNPIHVFDLDKLASEKIIIRNAKTAEAIELLGSEIIGNIKKTKVVLLNNTDMVIADEKNILAIAGVKGGKVAEVDENTKNIIIEVANFDPTSVRKTAKKINIYTDAVKRFENNLSPEIASVSMNDMTALILEMCSRATIEKVVDVYPQKQEKRILSFNIDKISKILGIEVKTNEVKDILDRDNISFKNSGSNFKITVPVERLDLQREEDIAEEIGRVLGYDKIKSILPKREPTTKIDETFYKILWTRNKLLNDGYSEVMTYAFCDKGEVEVLASASDKKFLRTNLTDGLKESVRLNQLNIPLLDVDNIKIFEIGTVFTKNYERMNIAYGDKKNITEVTLDEFCEDIPITELDTFFEKSLAFNSEFNIFKTWSIYPFISRDIAVWVPEGTAPEKLIEIYKSFGTELLIKEPKLFDSFTKIIDGKEKTSFAYRLVFQADDRTLTDEEINVIMANITNKVLSLGFEVR